MEAWIWFGFGEAGFRSDDRVCQARNLRHSPLPCQADTNTSTSGWMFSNQFKSAQRLGNTEVLEIVRQQRYVIAQSDGGDPGIRRSDRPSGFFRSRHNAGPGPG